MITAVVAALLLASSGDTPSAAPAAAAAPPTTTPPPATPTTTAPAHKHLIAPPVVFSGDVLTRAHRSAVAIAAVLGGDAGVSACIEALPDNVDAEVAFVIGKDGAVLSVTPPTAAAACAANAIQRVKFGPDPAERDEVSVQLKKRKPGPVIMGSLSKDVIRDVVTGNAAGVRACYDAAVKLTPGIAGKVTMKWTVGPTGAVTAVSTEFAGENLDAVATCLTPEIARWVFPKPKGGGVVIVSYPFVFKQQL